MSEIIDIDESQRIGRILDGKREEYAWFVKTYSQQVLSFTSRLMPDSEDAKEVAQDAFVKAFHSLGTFNFRSSFCTWVCRIAYRKSLDRLKRQQPHYVDIDNLPAIADEELSTGREERIAMMEEAIDNLTDDEQLLIHFYYYEDRQLRDIAYIMDVEPNALATRLHRIRKKLSQMIIIRQKVLINKGLTSRPALFFTKLNKYFISTVLCG